MDSTTYAKHLAVFELSARPLLEAVRANLQFDGYKVQRIKSDTNANGSFLQIEVRGEDGNAQGVLFVELHLLNGDVAGFGPDPDSGQSQVAVALSVVDGKGQVRYAHMPFKHTPMMGVHDAVALTERVGGYFVPALIATLAKGLATRYIHPVRERFTLPEPVAKLDRTTRQLQTNTGSIYAY